MTKLLITKVIINILLYYGLQGLNFSDFWQRVTYPEKINLWVAMIKRLENTANSILTDAYSMTVYNRDT